ncbi:transcription elongation factor GreA [Patescibacteria group bacterium]
MTNLITKEGFAKLQARLQFLKKTKRAEISKQIEEALSLGNDSAENLELEIARQEQAMVETEIADLEGKLDSAEIIKKQRGSKQTVKVGSVVKVKSDAGEWEFHIVGAMEANPKEGKISLVSPIGQALLNKREGDRVQVDLPDGEMEYEICAVS